MNPNDAASGICCMQSGFVLRDGSHNIDLRATGRTSLDRWAADLHGVPTQLSPDQYGPAISSRYPLGHYVGYPPSGSPTDLTVPLPDIYAGETKSIVLCLKVAAPPAAAQPLLQVTLNYLPAEDGAQPMREAVTVTALVSDDPALLAAPPDPEVLRQADLARAAQAAEEAVRVADAGDATAGAQVLEHAAAHLVVAAPLDSPAAAEAAMLREQAAHMRAQGYDAGLRKRLRHQSHQTRSGRQVPPRA